MMKVQFEAGDEVIYINYKGDVVYSGTVIYVGTGKYIRGRSYGKDQIVVQTEDDYGVHTWLDPNTNLKISIKGMLRKRLKNG